MCSYRPWWWWMASSRSCSSEGKSTSPHALHHESTLLMYCGAGNARTVIHTATQTLSISPETQQLFTSLWWYQQSHVSQTHHSTRQIAWRAFLLLLLGLKNAGISLCMVTSSLKTVSEELSLAECVFLGLWWHPGTFCNPWREGNKIIKWSQSHYCLLKHLSRDNWNKTQGF